MRRVLVGLFCALAVACGPTAEMMEECMRECMATIDSYEVCEHHCCEGDCGNNVSGDEE